MSVRDDAYNAVYPSPNLVSTNSFEKILTFLNDRRLLVEKEEIVHSFSGIVTYSDLTILRNGIIEILEDYGYTDLPDAFDVISNFYPDTITWKTWDQNIISIRSLREIFQILDTMKSGTIMLSDMIQSSNLYITENIGYWGGYATFTTIPGTPSYSQYSDKSIRLNNLGSSEYSSNSDDFTTASYYQPVINIPIAGFMYANLPSDVEGTYKQKSNSQITFINLTTYLNSIGKNPGKIIISEETIAPQTTYIRSAYINKHDIIYESSGNYYTSINPPQQLNISSNIQSIDGATITVLSGSNIKSLIPNPYPVNEEVSITLSVSTPNTTLLFSSYDAEFIYTYHEI